MQLARDTRGLTQVRSDLEPRASESLQCGFFYEIGLVIYNSKFELGTNDSELFHVSIIDYLKDPRCDVDSITLPFSLMQADGPVVMLSAQPSGLAMP